MKWNGLRKDEHGYLCYFLRKGPVFGSARDILSTPGNFSELKRLGAIVYKMLSS